MRRLLPLVLGRRAVRRCVKDMAAKERVYLSDPKNVEEMRSARVKNQMDEKFCWK